jgi:hypothetical protein
MRRLKPITMGKGQLFPRPPNAKAQAVWFGGLLGCLTQLGVVSAEVRQEGQNLGFG